MNAITRERKLLVKMSASVHDRRIDADIPVKLSKRMVPDKLFHEVVP